MKNTILLFLMLILLQTSFCQQISRQVISSSGGEARTSKTIINYTIGEPIVTTYDVKPNSLTQGFQQGDITIEKHIESTYVNPESNISYNQNISVFPNPTSGLITLSLDGIETISDYTYKLYDLIGRIIKYGFPENIQTQIDISYLSSGAYILVVTGLDKPVKEFKIIKAD